MSTEEKYNGWTNRETWAVALHINNDQGWQESVHQALRDVRNDVVENDPNHEPMSASHAGEVIREDVESTLDMLWETGGDTTAREALRGIVSDLGSLHRVNWTELGSSFLSDMEEVDSDS